MLKSRLNAKTLSWSPTLAYVIGLITTDGSLSKDGRHISFKSTDRLLVEIIKKVLLLKNKISEIKNNKGNRKIAYRIQFGNVCFYKWLVAIGITPAKTYTIGHILIPPRYFKDFLRGHLDGDGSIVVYTDRYAFYKGKRYSNTRIYTKFISASEKHARWLKEMITKNSKLKGALIKNTPKGNRVNTWDVKFSKRESIKLLQWIYYSNNIPSLKRKRDIAELYFSLF